MLDKYWFGDSTRISPEAPVPVVKIQRTEDRIGGAGNVALNIANLNGDVTLLSIVGNDRAGRNLEKKLLSHHVKTNLVHSDSIPTIEKLRIVARNQQMCRCDFEEKPSKTLVDEIFKIYSEIASEFDLVIFSDYAKGVLTHVQEMIALAAKLKIPALVDPKGNNFQKYAGSFAITPNKAELKEVIGNWNNEEELLLKAEQLRQKLNLDSLVLTRSEEGMTIFNNEGSYSIAANAKEVYDVSGAGDTAIAVMGLLYANGYPFMESVKLANKASGIVVGKFGTSLIEYSELFGE